MAVQQSEVRFINRTREVVDLTPATAMTPTILFSPSRAPSATNAAHRNTRLSRVETDDSGQLPPPEPQLRLLLDYLVNSLSRPNSVVAILAEPVEDNGAAVHITTFADPLDEPTREAVYSAECDLIDKFENTRFDFHLRQPQRVQGRIVIPPSPYAMILWQRSESDACSP